MTKTAEQTQALLPPMPDGRALNSKTHGIRSEHVPPEERAAYAEHVQALRESLDAQTYLEIRLADRAALALWRLDRVARYEAAESAQEQREQALGAGHPGLLDTLTDPKPGSLRAALLALMGLTGETREVLARDPVGEAEPAARTLDDLAAAFEHLAAGEALAPWPADLADEVGERLARHLLLAQVTPARLVRAALGRSPRSGEAESVRAGDWTWEPGELPGLLALAGEVLGDGLVPVLRAFAGGARDQAGRVRAAAQDVAVVLATGQALAALPHDRTLDKVARYEAHLERVLYRALHELEALRDRRQGRPAPLARLDVHGDPDSCG